MPGAVAASPNAVDQSWSQVWQLPVLLLGLGLFAAGVWLALPEKEPNNFPGRLNDVAYYLEAGNHEDARRALDEIAKNLDQPDATVADKGRFHQYQADLIYLEMHAGTLVEVDTPASRQNNTKVAAAYTKAEDLGHKLDGKSFRRFADTLVALGRDADALAMVERMTDEPAHRRYAIVRSLIERQRTRRDGRGADDVMPLLERFKSELRTESEAPRRREQELWAACLEARMQLEAGDPQRAIDFLLMRVQRFQSQGGDTDLSELFVLLAQSYQMTGDFAAADRYYRFAQQKLPGDSGLNAQILLGLGQLALLADGEGNVQQAMEHFAQAVKHYPSESAYLEALVGLADCEARLESYPESVEHFTLAVEGLTEQTPTWDERRESTVATVRSHMARAVDGKHFDLALDFLTLLTPLFEELPADMLLDFATIHRSIAEKRQAHAEDLAQRLLAGDANIGDEARRLANREAGLNYEKAAEYFLRHAKAVTITDDAGHGASLWEAAVCFDRAQAWSRAIETFAEFVETRQNDARRLAAIQRLGQAYLADDQPEPAAQLFLQLVDDHPNSPETFESLVPLARAELALGRLDAAERTLLQVVTDHPAITPESQQYQRALVELGKLYYGLGDKDGDYYVQAIERLEEAVERYGDGDDGPTLRFLLADAYRKSIDTLDRRLEERQSQSERLALQAERGRRLERAQMLYSQVAHELDAKPDGMLSTLEELYRRNAAFYQADCAYDRGQFEESIRLYDNAARRWERDPASLVALVQIVNAHCELGQYQQAKVANEAARWQLQRMPEESFKDATLPMTRKHWEDWLRWTSELDFAAAEARTKAKPASNPASR